MPSERTLSRDVVATQIPSGDKQTLTAGTQVVIHQVLGGTYTVQSGFFAGFLEKFKIRAVMLAKDGS